MSSHNDVTFFGPFIEKYSCVTILFLAWACLCLILSYDNRNVFYWMLIARVSIVLINVISSFLVIRNSEYLINTNLPHFIDIMNYQNSFQILSSLWFVILVALLISTLDTIGETMMILYIIMFIFITDMIFYFTAICLTYPSEKEVDSIGVVYKSNIKNPNNIIKILSRLPSIVFSSDDDYEKDKCCICLNEFSSDDKIKKLNCGHMHHTECIRDWMYHKMSCPLCKENIN